MNPFKVQSQIKSGFFSKILFGFLFLTVPFINSCEEVEFRDGRIPNEYVSVAKPLMGTYVGHIGSRDNQLTLKLESNLAMLSFKNRDGADIIGKNCGSQVGRLLRGKVDSDSKVEYLIFSFKPGSCNIAAKEIRLDFENAYNKIIVSLQGQGTLDQQCEWSDHGRNPPTAPIYECRDVVRTNLIRGAFFKRYK